MWPAVQGSSLVVTLVWAVWSLRDSGSWRGCVLSGAWCVGEGLLAPEGDRQPQGRVLWLGLPGLVAGMYGLQPWRRCKPKWRRWRLVSMGCLLFTVLALVVPMSCGSLTPREWIYVGANDWIHDLCLLGILLCLNVSFCVSPIPCRRMALVNCAAGLGACCAVGMLYLVFQCPQLQDASRAAVLALEVAALGLGYTAHLRHFAIMTVTERAE
mmetsp:Transcript_17012/g.49551  ORF Transcript_17012/g.49551 Transcript_17012/m.49551 type:complete len:212 (+) Transcript_17012:21-656(+)